MAEESTDERSGITPIVMPKWGLSMKEGTVVGLAGRGGHARSASARRSSRSRPTRSPTRSRRPTRAAAPQGGAGRRGAAGEGAARRDGRPGCRDAEIDAYIAAYVAPAATRARTRRPAPAYQFAEVDGIRMRYARRGPAAGVPVLFIHGFGGDLDNWLFNLDALAEKSPVIALDLPGHGQSTVRLPGTSAGRRWPASSRASWTRSASSARTRRPFDGRRDRRAAGARSPPQRVASLTLIDSAGLGRRDQRRLHRGLRRGRSRGAS